MLLKSVKVSSKDLLWVLSVVLCTVSASMRSTCPTVLKVKFVFLYRNKVCFFLFCYFDDHHTVNNYSMSLISCAVPSTLKPSWLCLSNCTAHYGDTFFTHHCILYIKGGVFLVNRKMELQCVRLCLKTYFCSLITSHKTRFFNCRCSRV